MEPIIKIAIQKSGRLSESSQDLIRACGIYFNNGLGKLKSNAVNFPAEFLFLRDDDIPGYVSDGVADIGIVGENVVEETGTNVTLLKRLNFGKCRLSLAIPREKEYTCPQHFEGLKIATSYPRILSNFFKKKNVNASLHEISGSVEIAPGIGLADGICDIVSSGSTLFTNGLKEVEIVMHSEAVLISNPDLEKKKNEIVKKLMFRIDAVNEGKKHKYILLNAPNDCINDIVKLIPGARSPTITPLANPGWSSLQSVIHDERFWNVIEELREVGAQDIIILPIEKMVS